MKPRLPALLAILTLAATSSPGLTRDYHANRALETALREVAAADNALFALSELTRDAADRPVWMIRVGSDAPGESSVLLVAGLDGRHLVGTEVALGILQDLAGSPESARALLDGRTLYVVPRVNLQGADAFFSSTVRRETAGLAGEGDHDRDGLTGEDREDDLNGDGRITLVRVADPAGGYVLDGPEGAFPRKARPEKGERGAWRILTEGRDDDGDEAWNEEADGGVNPARNFTQGYPWFARDAGPNPVSEPETRALADFIAAHRNLAAVVVFGFEDNLLTPPSEKNVSDPDLEARRWGRKPVTRPNTNDVPLIRHIAEQYREDLGLGAKAKDLASGGPGVSLGEVGTGALTTPEHAAAGGLAEFVYFTRGRLALATPVWTPGVQLAREREGDEDGGEGDPGNRREPGKKPGRGEGEERARDPGEPPDEGQHGEPDRAGDAASGGSPDEGEQSRSEPDPALEREASFRDWLLVHDPAAWIPWAKIEHPDFPGREAYAGGFAPFARINPPAAILDDLVEPHAELIRRLFGQLPRVRIREAKLEALGAGVHALTVTVENTGYLPDVLAHGAYSSQVRPTRVELAMIGGGEVLGGAELARVGRLPGSGGSEERRFLVRLPSDRDAVEVTVISEVGGRDAVRVRPGQTVEGRR